MAGRMPPSLGKVPVLEDDGSHEGPHVQAEAHPGGDHLHPHRRHVRRNRVWDGKTNVSLLPTLGKIPV